MSRPTRVVMGKASSHWHSDGNGWGIGPREKCKRCMKAAAPAAGMLHRSALGLRFNAGKSRPGLSSPWAMEGLAKVSEYGARKYAPWNWAKGLSWGETLDCLERHLIAFKKGEELDAESGLPHIDHLLWNAMALSHFQKLGHGVDDRWKGQPAGVAPAAPMTPRMRRVAAQAKVIAEEIRSSLTKKKQSR